jgi:hypothetical protein
MKGTWGAEFNKNLFIYYVNSKLKTTIGLEDFDSTLSLIPPLMQGAVLHELVKGPKIKTWKQKPLQMPPKTAVAVEQAKKKRNMSIHSWKAYFTNNLQGPVNPNIVLYNPEREYSNFNDEGEFVAKTSNNTSYVLKKGDSSKIFY